MPTILYSGNKRPRPTCSAIEKLCRTVPLSLSLERPEVIILRLSSDLLMVRVLFHISYQQCNSFHQPLYPYQKDLNNEILPILRFFLNLLVKIAMHFTRIEMTPKILKIFTISRSTFFDRYDRFIVHVDDILKFNLYLRCFLICWVSNKIKPNRNLLEKTFLIKNTKHFIRIFSLRKQYDRFGPFVVVEIFQ